MYQLDRAKQTITINGDVFSSEAFNDNKLPEFGTDLFKRDLFLFLQDWFSESLYLTLRTSGSTGIPKEIRVEKDRMMQSARLTCSFLDLSKGDTALLCMSLDILREKWLL